jgi:hypothetical protein
MNSQKQEKTRFSRVKFEFEMCGVSIFVFLKIVLDVPKLIHTGSVYQFVKKAG